MDNQNLTQSKEQLVGAERARETQAEKPKLSDYERRAERVSVDPNVEAAEHIRKLNGSLETAGQMEGLTALETALVGILSKLSKKGVDIRQLNTPQKLEVAVLQNKLTLNLPEAAALESLDHVLTQAGPTARHISETWPATVEAGKEASEGLGEKYMNHMKENPVATTALTVAGAAGIYLGFELIKGLFSGKEEAGEAGKEKKSKFRKEVLIPVVLMIAGAFLGKEKVKEMMASMGLDYFDIKDKVKKGEEFTAEQKAKIEKGGPAAAAAVAAIREQEGVPARPATPEEAAEMEEAKDIAVETGEEIVKSKNNQLKASIAIFMKGYFYERLFNDDVVRNRVSSAIRRLGQTPLSTIKEVVEEAKKANRTSIDPATVGLEKNMISEKELYFTLLKIDELHHLLAKNRDIQTVDDLFLAAINSPSQVVSASALGSIHTGGLEGLMGGFDLNLKEKFPDMQKGILDGLNERFQSTLEDEDKKELRALQALILVDSILVEPSEDILEQAVQNLGRTPSVEVMNEAGRFIEFMKHETEALIPHLVERYGIPDADGNVQLEELLRVENLTFKRAGILLGVSHGMDWRGEVPPTKDLGLISAMISAIPANSRMLYIGQLSEAILMEETNIKLPAIRNLKPILSKFASVAMEKFYDSGISVLQYTDSFKWLKGINGIDGETLALILGMAGVSPKELDQTGSGEEFLKLLANKGAVIACENRNRAILAVQLGVRTFFMKPAETLWSSIGSLKDGDWEG
ncbi:MAG: hypothetical protein OEY44_04645, partial [Candidatus Peregrinibacteria bacterium]|nr:hypothetical protein [Candidatus Peregrinibacteria bacterium]